MSAMMHHLAALLDAGYQVAFTKDPEGYVASVSGPGGYEHDAIAATADLAVWTASPLHDDDEPYPWAQPAVLPAEILRLVDQAGYARGVRDGWRDHPDERLRLLGQVFRDIADEIRAMVSELEGEVPEAADGGQ